MRLELPDHLKPSPTAAAEQPAKEERYADNPLGPILDEAVRSQPQVPQEPAPAEPEAAAEPEPEPADQPARAPNKLKATLVAVGVGLVGLAAVVARGGQGASTGSGNAQHAAGTASGPAQPGRGGGILE